MVETNVHFLPTFKSILAMELQTAYHNRDSKFTDKHEVLYEFKLAQRIISYAKEQSPPTTTEFNACSFYTSFSRKPMAFALSMLGSCMHCMLTEGHHEMLLAIAEESGMTDIERDDSLISFLIEKTGLQDFNFAAVIAETYHVAAETQLPDDTQTAILWWGYSAHICYAGNYKLKDLRNAINKAIAATQLRDDDLWGPSMWRGSAHQKLSLLVARFFEEKSGSFVLPQVTQEKRSGRPEGSLAIFCGDHLICPNFHRAIRLDNERQNGNRAGYDDYFDTAEVEQEHGAEAEAEIEQEQSTEF